MERVTEIFAAITTVALVTTLVSHRQTAQIVTSVGRAYSGALRAAMGK